MGAAGQSEARANLAKKVETGFVGGSSCAGQALAEDARFSWDYRPEKDPWDLIGEDCWCLGLVQ